MNNGPRSGILAGGNWIVDKLKIIDTYPQQDALSNIISQSIGNGGSPFNILMDLAKLGVPFPLAGIGLVGNDADGAWIREECRANSIDTTQLSKCVPKPTSYTDVMTVQSTGRRTFFHQRGANALLDAEHFDFASTNARIFHLGYLLLLDRLDAPDSEFGTIAARVLHQAQVAGCKTSIDVVSEDSDRFARIVFPSLPHTNYCILNEFEIQRTTGINVRDEGAIDLLAVERAARQLLNVGVQDWVIVHFPEGACALAPTGPLRVQPSVLVAQMDIVSTVGAGDAFAAGVLFGLHEGAAIETALRYGVCTAAACLRGTGASDGVQSLSDCLAIGECAGFRQLLHK